MRRQPLRRPGGFTIIEVMITVVIAGILVAMAVPSFQGFVANQRVKTNANDLLMAMLHTRSEAVKRNANVTIVPASDEWNKGWCVYLDSVATKQCPYTGAIDDADAPIRTQGALTGVTIDTDADSVTFGANGRLVGDSLTFDLCDVNNKAMERELRIGLTGSPIVTLQGACGS